MRREDAAVAAAAVSLAATIRSPPLLLQSLAMLAARLRLSCRSRRRSRLRSERRRRSRCSCRCSVRLLWSACRFLARASVGDVRRSTRAPPSSSAAVRIHSARCRRRQIPCRRRSTQRAPRCAASSRCNLDRYPVVVQADAAWLATADDIDAAQRERECQRRRGRARGEQAHEPERQGVRHGLPRRGRHRSRATWFAVKSLGSRCRHREQRR